MSFYGLSDEAVMKMPFRRFWLLHRNVDRLMAERDLRMFQAVASAQANQQGLENYLERMTKQMGVIYEADVSTDPETSKAAQSQSQQLDRVGVARLKLLAASSTMPA